MELTFSKCDYNYLRPPKDVFNVTHTEYYQRHGEGKKAVRKIFADVDYTTEELAKLKEFEALIEKEKLVLPQGWTSVNTKKFMYSGKLDLKKSLKILKQHLEWKASPERGFVGSKAYKMMEEGIMYISGRDKQYRPVIVVNIYKVDPKKWEVKDFVQTISFVLDVAVKYYFVPGKVENWIIIIETNGAGFWDFPLKLVKSINDVTSVNYTSTLDKLYIMNPSTLLKKSWTFVQSYLDPETATKISMLQKEDYPELLEKIPRDQLEQCYGGTLPSRSTYWPPVNTLNQPPYTEDYRAILTTIQTEQQSPFEKPAAKADGPDLSEASRSQNEIGEQQPREENQFGDASVPLRKASRLAVEIEQSYEDQAEAKQVNEPLQVEERDEEVIEQWEYRGSARRGTEEKPLKGKHIETDESGSEEVEHKNEPDEIKEKEKEGGERAEESRKASISLEKDESGPAFCGLCGSSSSGRTVESSGCSIF